jgi:alpha-glucosidase
MTTFSFEGEHPGPLNPNEPLYQSSPFIVEHNPTPSGAFAGKPYAHGILIDNTSQTYVNLRQGTSHNKYSN